MTYRLFYTDSDVPKAMYEALKPTLMSYVYDELDDALGKARQIKLFGGVPWEIERADGPAINRYQIDKLLDDRAAELVNRPKVY